MKKLPHILIFNPDQWRGDVLGHTGNPAAVTPNLDQFVKQDAVSFRHAFCQHPVCTPSRSSFMSGWYPHIRGHRSLFHRISPMCGRLKQWGRQVASKDLVNSNTYWDIRSYDLSEKTAQTLSSSELAFFDHAVDFSPRIQGKPFSVPRAVRIGRSPGIAPAQYLWLLGKSWARLGVHRLAAKPPWLQTRN